MDENTRVVGHDQLLRRIRGEYLEMPGLRLRREQAQRLWGLDRDACLELLEALVQAGFLHKGTDGSYARLSDGSVRQPAISMAKATLATQPTSLTSKSSSAA